MFVQVTDMIIVNTDAISAIIGDTTSTAKDTKHYVVYLYDGREFEIDEEGYKNLKDALRYVNNVNTCFSEFGVEVKTN